MQLASVRPLATPTGFHTQRTGLPGLGSRQRSTQHLPTVNCALLSTPLVNLVLDCSGTSQGNRARSRNLHPIMLWV